MLYNGGKSLVKARPALCKNCETKANPMWFGMWALGSPVKIIYLNIIQIINKMLFH